MLYYDTYYIMLCRIIVCCIIASLSSESASLSGGSPAASRRAGAREAKTSQSSRGRPTRPRRRRWQKTPTPKSPRSLRLTSRTDRLAGSRRLQRLWPERALTTSTTHSASAAMGPAGLQEVSLTGPLPSQSDANLRAAAGRPGTGPARAKSWATYTASKCVFLWDSCGPGDSTPQHLRMCLSQTL